MQCIILSFFTFICFYSVGKLCLNVCSPMDYSMTGSPVLHYLLKFAQTQAHWVSDDIQPSHPLPPPSPPALNIKSIRVSSNESAFQITWPKCCSYSFSISPPNDYWGLISFSIDWFNLLAVHRTLKSFLQHHSSKASILLPSAIFMVQLSHPYMTTGKTIALTIRINTNPCQTLLEKNRSL